MKLTTEKYWGSSQTWKLKQHTSQLPIVKEETTREMKNEKYTRRTQ